MRVRQLMAHTKMWPYPSTSANLLKLFTDLQVFLVTLTGLILKIDPESDSISRGFGWTGSLYGDLMWVLLLITAVPTVFALVYKTPVEKAQKFLHKAARVDLDDEGSTVAQRRLTLRRRVQDSAPRSRATSRAGDGRIHADAGRHEETLNPLAEIPTQSDSQWTEQFSERHNRKYWVNSQTKQSTWTDPNPGQAGGAAQGRAHVTAGRRGLPSTVPRQANTTPGHTHQASPSTSAQVADDQQLPAWTEKFSQEHNRSYYVNRSTGEKSWIKPNVDPSELEELEEAEV
jgi:hypothetical protein